MMENETAGRSPRHERKRFQPFLSYRMWPDTKHLDVLDGVRVLCVLLVGWFHIWQQGWLTPQFQVIDEYISLDFLLRSGYLWVDGLLLLSGFLLYLPYTQAGNKLPSAGAFYKRRLIRILPSYLLCVVPMFILSCVQGKYGQTSDAVLDILSHLTFTHNLFYFSYLRSPLNGALWTLAVEMQFYLIFPLLARAFRKLPITTYVAMAGGAFVFRYYASLQSDTSMYFNQLPAFLDVYANGFVAASVFAALRKRFGNEPDAKIRLFFTVTAVLCAALLTRIAQAQAYSPSGEIIRQGQMDRRFSLSAALACLMVCAAFSLPVMRFALGNRVMHFLSLISFQFYIYHQMLAVTLKEWGFPPSAYDEPWAQGDYRWQLTYTICCFVFALTLAALITFLFERPIARVLRRRTGAEKG